MTALFGGGGKDPLDRYRAELNPEAAAKETRARNTKRGIIVLVVVGVFVFLAGWNPPTGTLHNFTKASDYDSEKESGCTNSGEGCHGSEKAYTDFNVYHPNAQCTTCHDYQGVGCIPCHKPSQHECALCHDGTMEKAGDVVRLTDQFPRGHYRETTHTAMGTDMRREMHASKSGEATASCHGCHSSGLKDSHTAVAPVPGSPYGTDVGCGECHNDVRSFGMAEVVGNWKDRACEDCHKVNSSAPMHSATVADAVEGTGPLGCGDTGRNCHNGNDLHGLHPDDPQTCSSEDDSGTPICHDLEAEAALPPILACGGIGETACHRSYQNGTYGHRKDRAVHSPENEVPADDTSYFGTRCGGCHRMDPDGRSLVDEHLLSTSAKTLVSESNCRNCHNEPASTDAIESDWSMGETIFACEQCHGQGNLPGLHGPDIGWAHAGTGSEGCAESGRGCHPTADLSSVGRPTPTSGLHLTCLRCHDWRRSGGNMDYSPGADSCGPGGSCHAGAGDYDPDTDVHDGSGGLSDGFDGAHHTATGRFLATEYTDTLSGVREECTSCHSRVLGIEHSRANSSLAVGSGTLCVRCHNREDATAEVVKDSWPEKGTANACKGCHGSGTTPVAHEAIDAVHVATELDPFGAASPGACSASGCHVSSDLRRVHWQAGCALQGCHSASGAISGVVTSCGGLDPTVSCHVGYTATQHFVSHAADMNGTVGGIDYSVTRNVGCFGCHFTDLRSEHSTALVSGSMDGGGVTSCAVCHEDPNDPGRGAFSDLSKVTDAIERGDRRCVACHSSGSSHDGPSAVASPHKEVTSTVPRPAGKVWSDPLEGWRKAHRAETGGGHNALTAEVVGVGTLKRFPIWQFTVDGTGYTWELPPNAGATAWLRDTVYGATAVSTPENISHIQLTCDDCHSFGADPAGPHGASVQVRIDPAYSQTEYADPTPMAFQFEATGTDRVVCMKCHPMEAQRNPLVKPGGHPVHAAHVQHTERYPASDETHYGGKCIDCHVRIPHAWKRPRLLTRTVVTTDGVSPDRWPYVRTPHTGLAGVKLKSYQPTLASLRAGSCVTGGCYDAHTPTWHPWPSDVATATYWP